MTVAAKLAPRLAATMEARAVEARRNHERAPWAAGIVSELRGVFGSVEVLYVREGDFVKGRPDALPWVQACPEPMDEQPTKRKGRR